MRGDGYKRYIGKGVSGISMVFFFQAEAGMRDLVRSRGLGNVYKKQITCMRADACCGSEVFFFSHAHTNYKHRLSISKLRKIYTYAWV